MKLIPLDNIGIFYRTEDIGSNDFYCGYILFPYQLGERGPASIGVDSI